MSITVKLYDVVDAIDSATENLSYYLDKRTGEIVMLTSEEIDAAEADEPMFKSSEFDSEWDRESILKAREVPSGAAPLGWKQA